MELKGTGFMPDLITGVLVLQPLEGMNLYRCHFQYTRAAGDAHHSWILMKERTLPGPTADPGSPLWEFDRAEPWLHCRPSVRIRTSDDPNVPDYFHNEGYWENHYVQMAQPVGKADPDAFDVHYAINWPAEGRTKEQRDEVILAYRARGVLL
jgi:hypothetical protein